MILHASSSHQNVTTKNCWLLVDARDIEAVQYKRLWWVRTEEPISQGPFKFNSSQYTLSMEKPKRRFNRKACIRSDVPQEGSGHSRGWHQLKQPCTNAKKLDQKVLKWKSNKSQHVKLPSSSRMTKNCSEETSELCWLKNEICAQEPLSAPKILGTKSPSKRCMEAICRVCLSKLRRVHTGPCLLAEMMEKLIQKWAENLRYIHRRMMKRYQSSQIRRGTPQRKQLSTPSTQKSVIIPPVNLVKLGTGHNHLSSPHQPGLKNKLPREQERDPLHSGIILQINLVGKWTSHTIKKGLVP